VADKRGQDVQEHRQRLNPLDLVDEFGADALRYFLIREMNVGQDGDFSRELFLVRYNSDLANDLGNLVNRVLNMTSRFAGGVVPAAGADGDDPSASCAASGRRPGGNTWPSSGSSSSMPGSSASSRSYAPSTGMLRSAPLEARQVRRGRRQGAPRGLARTMAEALRLAAVALRPVMPGAVGKDRRRPRLPSGRRLA
jgi:methionyl-tRNA synthetase